MSSSDRSRSELPARPSLEYLKKLAKERLAALRAESPGAQLAQAQLELAREHGFPSWRALKAEIERRQSTTLAEFFGACRRGDVPALAALLDADRALGRARGSDAATGLHHGAAHAGVVRLLLAHGADVSVRELQDNATALHFAAGAGALESVRALLDAGADVHGAGDAHHAGVIGWATGNGVRVSRELVALLLERRARHHIFSAIALGDAALVEALVLGDPGVLSARRSRFESGQTPLHFALFAPDGLESHPPDYALARLLLELGADPDAPDGKGRTPYERALLGGDREAVALLAAHGATAPAPQPVAGSSAAIAASLDSVRKQVPMLRVADLPATVAWYLALGFRLQARHPPEGELDFASLACGESELMLVPGGATTPEQGLSLWHYTERVPELYAQLRARKLAGTDPPEHELRFGSELHSPFYGGLEFSVLDPNGVCLVFKTP